MRENKGNEGKIKKRKETKIQENKGKEEKQKI